MHTSCRTRSSSQPAMAWGVLSTAPPLSLSPVWPRPHPPALHARCRWAPAAGSLQLRSRQRRHSARRVVPLPGALQGPYHREDCYTTRGMWFAAMAEKQGEYGEIEVVPLCPAALLPSLCMQTDRCAAPRAVRDTPVPQRCAPGP